MSVVRWDPFRELEEVNERLNRVFGRSLLPTARAAEGNDTMTTFDWSPSVDIAETPEEFQVKAELPEVKKEDVKVWVDQGILRIQGERKRETEEKGKKFHRIERSYGTFMRSFSLPDTVDEARVKAEFKDGILNVHLPKAERSKPKAIEVKVQ